MVTPEQKDYFTLSLLKHKFGENKYVEWDLSICVAAPVTEGRIVSVEEIFMRYGIDIKVVSNDSYVFITLYGDWSYLWVMDFSIFNPGGWSAASDRAIVSSVDYSFAQDWDPGDLGIPIWGY